MGAPLLISGTGSNSTSQPNGALLLITSVDNNFSYATSAIEKITHSTRAVYNKTPVINRSASVVSYSYTEATEMSCTIKMLAGTEEEHATLEDVRAGFIARSYSAGVAGQDPPSLLLVTWAQRHELFTDWLCTGDFTITEEGPFINMRPTFFTIDCKFSAVHKENINANAITPSTKQYFYTTLIKAPSNQGSTNSGSGGTTGSTGGTSGANFAGPTDINGLQVQTPLFDLGNGNTSTTDPNGNG